MAFSQSQRKSLTVGIGLLLAASAAVVLLWAGTYLPGFAGEMFSMVAGIFWTPVLLDISLFIMGFALILWLNKVRLDREGDEYVYLEQVDPPEDGETLPAEARSAVYAAPPAELAEKPEVAAIEGALALGDQAQATDMLLKLSEEELNLPEVLAVRVQLARQQDRHSEAEALVEKLRAISPDHSLCQPDSDGTDSR